MKNIEIIRRTQTFELTAPMSDDALQHQLDVLAENCADAALHLQHYEVADFDPSKGLDSRDAMAQFLITVRALQQNATTILSQIFRMFAEKGKHETQDTHNRERSQTKSEEGYK